MQISSSFVAFEYRLILLLKTFFEKLMANLWKENNDCCTLINVNINGMKIKTSSKSIHKCVMYVRLFTSTSYFGTTKVQRPSFFMITVFFSRLSMTKYEVQDQKEPIAEIHSYLLYHKTISQLTHVDLQEIIQKC